MSKDSSGIISTQKDVRETSDSRQLRGSVWRERLENAVVAVFSLVVFAGAALYASGTFPHSEFTAEKDVLDSCPGYNATNIWMTRNTLTADLVLAGKPCNVYGNDLRTLLLQVTYETDTRIHVKISDPSAPRYEIPDSVVPRPGSSPSASRESAQIQFNCTKEPFSFNIVRRDSQEMLFDTNHHPIIFEPQYLRIKTNLPRDANIYGLGEHTDNFRLSTHNTTRTLWSRDAFGVPPGTNLYGNHPIYIEHRVTGTHGVFLMNSNGMDIKINDSDPSSGTTLEYNVIGGVLDFYFLAGSTSDPSEVARQYAEVVGLPAEVPYWSLGFHQCRYGYLDFVEVADVIYNYSKAAIPLETMWTDIDYMYKRWVFTNDPNYFPTSRMREIVDYLHNHDQYYVLMTDPAVAYIPGGNYGTFNRGQEKDLFLKNASGGLSLGVVWPGVTVFPDWFHPDIQDFWDHEFELFYDPHTGINIDGAWIDMNDPSSFCDHPCTDPFAAAAEQGMPPNRTTPPPSLDAPIFGQKPKKPRKWLFFEKSEKYAVEKPAYVEEPSIAEIQRQSMLSDSGATGVLQSTDNLLDPPYKIHNALPRLSDRTAPVDIVLANGLTMYDTHNLYGSMMSTATRNAMLKRRPGLRPFIITRSTFAGAGRHVGKWLGDNLSTWEHYRNSIAGILSMAAVYQIPMVGADICGFGDNTTEALCARWAMLGAFYPFMRNHADIAAISQEFYRWPIVAEAARKAIDMRYRLLDYIYTAFHRQSLDGTPILSPMWFKYPTNTKTFDNDLQFFYGDSILVSPAPQEDKTFDIYLPKDTFYDFLTFEPIVGRGRTMTIKNASLADIPVHIRGGAILPLRVESAMTTKALRSKDFHLVVAPDSDNTASGSLYFDDGISLVQKESTTVDMAYAKDKLTVTGHFGLPLGVKVARIDFLNVQDAPKRVLLNGGPLRSGMVTYLPRTKVLTVEMGIRFDSPFEVEIVRSS